MSEQEQFAQGPAPLCEHWEYDPTGKVRFRQGDTIAGCTRCEIERLTRECAEHIRKRGEAGERNIVLTAERDRLRAALEHIARHETVEPYPSVLAVAREALVTADERNGSQRS